MKEKVDIFFSSGQAPARLDVILAERLGISRSLAARLCETGAVVVDGRARKPSFTIKPGMRITGSIAREEVEDREIPEWEVPLKVIHEDESILVIDKPAGLVVHPGAGNTGETLVNALIARYPGIRSVGSPDRPGIVHRLDKLTSGVMVVALTREAHEKLGVAFAAHEHAREYRALCYGTPAYTKGTIETWMGRNPKDRMRMSSRVTSGRKAITHWDIEQQWSQITLLRLTLETGRTHQIRVHLSDYGHPVVGDPQYGGRRRANTLADPAVRAAVKACRRQMLHSSLLGITHPKTGQWMEFTGALPEDMQHLIALLNEREQGG